MNPHRQGVVLVTGAAIAWSSAGVLNRAIAASASVQLFWRAAFAGVCLLLVVAVQARGRVLSPFRRLGLPGLAVAFCFAVASSAFMLALGRTTVARVLFIQATGPFLAAALAWLVMRERVPRRTVVAMSVALAGVGVMVGGSLGASDQAGDLLAFLMAVAFSGAIVITRRHRDVLMTPATCLAMLLAVLFSAPLGDPGAVTGADLLLLAVLGAGQMSLGLALFAAGARLIRAAEAAIITVLEVVLGPVWVWIAYAERPDRATLLGGSIVLGAVLLHTLIDLRGARASHVAS